MSYFALAFFMGLFGSIHCVAMCGPLVLTFTADRGKRPRQVLVNTALYHVGRVAMYGVLGLAIGTIGYLVDIKNWQQGITLGTGLLLVSLGLFTLFGRRFQQLNRLQQRFAMPLTRWIGYWLYRPGGHFMVGMLNGLLPCGMVYMALAAALNADSMSGSGLFMLSFGMGTWPAMLTVTLISNFAKTRVKINFAFWLPIISIAMGCWFLLRGANLGIPYISPLIYPEGAIYCK